MLLLAQIWLMVKNRMCIACQYPACQTNDRAGSGYLARVYLVLYFRLYFTPEFCFSVLCICGLSLICDGIYERQV